VAKQTETKQTNKQILGIHHIPGDRKPTSISTPACWGYVW
jgi:hypothetical protein